MLSNVPIIITIATNFAVITDREAVKNVLADFVR